jgi:ribosome-binding ATPase YchF (GTP1/OBG family)
MSEIDPNGAADIIETELLLSDIQQCQKAIERVIKPAKAGDKDAKEKLAILEDVMKNFNEAKPARLQKIPPEINKEFQFLTAKPVLYVANSDEGKVDSKLMDSIQQRAKKENAMVVTLCTKLEAEIVQLPPEERSAYYEAAGITSPGLAALAKAGQQLLGLVCFFTAGPQETRAWLIPGGTRAVKAAGKIHSDIERGFIRAEIYKYTDLERHGNYKALQEKNLVTLEGKDYEILDGDVVYFRFSV